MPFDARPPALVRAAVYALLAAVVWSGFADVEAWPLTAFRLFSTARTERATGWTVALADRTGREHPLIPIALAQGTRGVSITVARFHSASDADKIATCAGWTVQGRRAGVDVADVRVYRRTRLLSERIGERGAPAVSRLRFVCRDGRVIAR